MNQYKTSNCLKNWWRKIERSDNQQKNPSGFCLGDKTKKCIKIEVLWKNIKLPEENQASKKNPNCEYMTKESFLSVIETESKTR